MDVNKLNSLFGRDITRCLRCGQLCNIGLSTYIDANSGYDYGQQIYLQCPKCKQENIFPWSSFLILPKDS